MSQQLLLGIFLGFVLTFCLLLTLAFKPVTCEDIIHRPVLVLPLPVPIGG